MSLPLFIFLMSVLNFAHLNCSVQKAKKKEKEKNPPSRALLFICTCKQLPIKSLSVQPATVWILPQTVKQKLWLDLTGRGVTAPLKVPLQFQRRRMSSCNCCAHYWTQSAKCIHLAWEHDCEKGEIKNGTASNGGINRRLEQMAAGTGWEDAGKRVCVCHAGVLIKVQRGWLSVCLFVWEKLINTQVIPIRSPTCSSYITSRDWNKESYWSYWSRFNRPSSDGRISEWWDGEQTELAAEALRGIEKSD